MGTEVPPPLPAALLVLRKKLSALWEDEVGEDNHEHRHSRIRFVTPAQRHQGMDIEILKRRSEVYQKAKENNPIRWSGKTRNWSHIDRVELNQENQTKIKA
jgi:hypothetical protein